MGESDTGDEVERADDLFGRWLAHHAAQVSDEEKEYAAESARSGSAASLVPETRASNDMDRQVPGFEPIIMPSIRKKQEQAGNQRRGLRGRRAKTDAEVAQDDARAASAGTPAPLYDSAPPPPPPSEGRRSTRSTSGSAPDWLRDLRDDPIPGLEPAAAVEPAPLPDPVPAPPVDVAPEPVAELPPEPVVEVEPEPIDDPEPLDGPELLDAPEPELAVGPEPAHGYEDVDDPEAGQIIVVDDGYGPPVPDAEDGSEVGELVVDDSVIDEPEIEVEAVDAELVEPELVEPVDATDEAEPEPQDVPNPIDLGEPTEAPVEVGDEEQDADTTSSTGTDEAALDADPTDIDETTDEVEPAEPADVVNDSPVEPDVVAEDEAPAPVVEPEPPTPPHRPAPNLDWLSIIRDPGSRYASDGAKPSTAPTTTAARPEPALATDTTPEVAPVAEVGPEPASVAPHAESPVEAEPLVEAAVTEVGTEAGPGETDEADVDTEAVARPADPVTPPAEAEPDLLAAEPTVDHEPDLPDAPPPANAEHAVETETETEVEPDETDDADAGHADEIEPEVVDGADAEAPPADAMTPPAEVESDLLAAEPAVDHDAEPDAGAEPRTAAPAPERAPSAWVTRLRVNAGHPVDQPVAPVAETPDVPVEAPAEPAEPAATAPTAAPDWRSRFQRSTPDTTERGEQPAPTTAASATRTTTITEMPDVHEFAPRRATRWLVTAVLGLGIVVTAYLAYQTYLDPSQGAVALAAVAAFVTAVVWAIRATTVVTYLTVRDGQLEIERDGGRFVFDLTAAQSPVEFIGTPGERGWKALFVRRGMPPFELTAASVDPVELTRVVRYHRPGEAI